EFQRHYSVIGSAILAFDIVPLKRVSSSQAKAPKSDSHCGGYSGWAVSQRGMRVFLQPIRNLPHPSLEPVPGASPCDHHVPLLRRLQGANPGSALGDCGSELLRRVDVSAKEALAMFRITAETYPCVHTRRSPDSGGYEPGSSRVAPEATSVNAI